jgi:hypothetical protein
MWNIFKSKKNKVNTSKINTCITCRFNEDVYCYVGTYYAAKGQNRICLEGELWESNNLNEKQ